MAAISHGVSAHIDPVTIFLRTFVVALTMATAAIHASLGGLLFAMNAAGYVVLAIAMTLPGLPARWRWLVRLSLMAFTAATIAGWVAFGPRFGLAYLDKAIEFALVGVLLVEQVRSDGGPAGVYRRIRRLVRGFAAGGLVHGAR